MAFRKLFLPLLVLSVACSKGGSGDNAPAGVCGSSVVSSEIMIGNNDWVLLSNVGIPAQTGNGRAVAQIKIPKISSSCTGFLINSDTIMTNNHCVSGSANAPGVTATFRLENQTKETFQCDQFIMTDAGYDFTLLKCKNSPGTKFGWVGLSTVKPELNSDLYVIQENCDYTKDIHCTTDKYVAYGDVLESSTFQIAHNADTLPGSSGSPVFSTANNKAIALHNAGGVVNGQQTNFAVPMYNIRNKIPSSVSVYDSGSYSGSGAGSTPQPGGSGGSGSPVNNTDPLSTDSSGC